MSDNNQNQNNPNINIQLNPPSIITVIISTLSIQTHGNESHIKPFAEVDLKNVSVIDGGEL